jgi:hypothetical protein
MINYYSVQLTELTNFMSFQDLLDGYCVLGADTVTRVSGAETFSASK